ncbi:unnamed protein product [Urochloa decumbens]|uniref:Uncharacterized protein n=1 Tax=Urochloa decumbens TaxID=240449 RepID=A0ABC8XFF4_9POAL
MPPAVRTRHTTTVSLPSDDGAPLLPPPGRRVPLSPFDANWAALPPVCHVFLFPAPSSSPPLPFQDVAHALKSSLSVVLPAFHPLAGELTYSPESRTAVSIILAEDAYVAFVEAETELEFARLVEERAEHEQDVVDVLRQLVPDIRRHELPAPVMAAQVTEFVGGSGGIAVGVAVHHAAVDGRGLWRFIEMWAAAAGVQQGRVAGEPAPPVHDRSLVRFDGDEEVVAVFLRQLTPDLPRVSHLPKVVPTQDPSRECRPMLSRRTFTLPASTVRRLKQRLAAAAATGASSRTPPSTFAALAAHAWVSLARASGFTDGGPVFAAFLADCRAHVSPPAPGSYAGNCVAPVMISLSGEEVAGADGPARAFLAIREAVEEVRRDPLADCGRWIAKFDDIPPGRTVVLVGSPRFPAYAVDFGFGTPARVEKTSLNHDGEISLLAGREAGSVQASVVISSDKMPAFREMFAADV